MNKSTKRLTPYIEAVMKGKIAMRQLDDLVGADDAVCVRRAVMEKLTGADLSAFESSFNYAPFVKKNAENVIGVIQLEVGKAGPLRVSGRDVYVPLATSEGALVAGVERGAKAVTLSGGCTSIAIDVGMTRAPLFRFENISRASEFVTWVNDNFAALAEQTAQTTGHGHLKSIFPVIVGNHVWLRFLFDTGDAMGMNMATIASERMVEHIEKAFAGAKCISMSGNLESDKKPALINEILGRGKRVVAEALITEKVLKEVLHTTAEAVHGANIAKNWYGSRTAGSDEHNAHFANIVAAMFAATGQDLAQIGTSSKGYTTTEVRGRDLYMTVTLPCLEVGTVGGGTQLPAQRAALSMIGVAGSGNPVGSNARKLAEIIGAVVLAGELNLLAALSARELGSAHRALGRGIKP